MPKVKTTLINAEDRNNTCKTTKGMPKVRNTSRNLQLWQDIKQKDNGEGK